LKVRSEGVTNIPLAEKDRLLYLDAVRTLPGAIFLVTSDRVLVDANPAGLRLLGLKTVEGLPLSAMVESPDIESQFRIWAQSPAPVPGALVWKTVDGPQALRLEAWCAQPARERQPALVIVQCEQFDNAADRFPLPDDRVELLRREVLARKRAEAQLAEAVKARDEFIAIAAHELRNPLNVFHLSLQLLYRRAGEVAGVREILDRSRFQLNRLNLLVEGLLDVSRIRSGRFELQLETFDLNELVSEVTARSFEQYPDVQISVETDPAAIGTWDRVRIDQAITNLLSNAIKYGEKKPVKVVVAVVRDEALVSITDQGIGLASGDVERIFEQFERATPRASSEGFGLGLWITRQIAEAHLGSVSAEGKLGKGSTFILRLPIQRVRL
jgi:signal transduction histidine kinase